MSDECERLLHHKWYHQRRALKARVAVYKEAMQEAAKAAAEEQ